MVKLNQRVEVNAVDCDTVRPFIGMKGRVIKLMPGLPFRGTGAAVHFDNGDQEVFFTHELRALPSEEVKLEPVAIA